MSKMHWSNSEDDHVKNYVQVYKLCLSGTHKNEMDRLQFGQQSCRYIFSFMYLL